MATLPGVVRFASARICSHLLASRYGQAQVLAGAEARLNMHAPACRWPARRVQYASAGCPAGPGHGSDKTRGEDARDGGRSWDLLPPTPECLDDERGGYVGAIEAALENPEI